jgi:hypothetical protein
MSRTMRYTSGWFLVMALAIRCIMRSARTGRRHDDGALAFSDGAEQIDDAGGNFFVGGLQIQLLVGIQGVRLSKGMRLWATAVSS